jgi:26S proteasome regulatory subunit N7
MSEYLFSFQIIKGSEILEVLHTNQDVKNYLFSLYNCQYADFFKNLGMDINFK